MHELFARLSMFKTVHILLACLVYLTLVACGTKGPLYIPEQRYPQEELKQPTSQHEGKTTAPEANSSAPSSPAQ